MAIELIKTSINLSKYDVCVYDDVADDVDVADLVKYDVSVALLQMLLLLAMSLSLM